MAKKRQVGSQKVRYKVWCGGRGKTFATLEEAMNYSNYLIRKKNEFYDVTQYYAKTRKNNRPKY